MFKEGAFIQPEKDTQRGDLQDRIYQAFAAGSDEDIKNLKQECLAAYPDQLEGVEALFCVRPLLQLSREISKFDNRDRSKPMPKELREKLQDITEYNFLLTHFIWKNGKTQEDKEFLDLFWHAFEKTTKNNAEYNEIQGRKVGILTQVATLKLFERQGLSPELTEPEKDAFDSIDLWVDTKRRTDDRHEQALQVKAGGQQEKPEVIETENIPAVSITFGPRGREELYASKAYSEARDFRTKVDRYRKNQPNLKGSLIVIPYHMIDHASGEPTDELFNAISPKLPAPPRTKQEKVAA